MRSIIAVTSALLQLVFLLGLGRAMLMALKFVQTTALYGPPDDPKIVAGATAAILVRLMVPVFCGVLGLALAWILLRKPLGALGWFRGLSRFFAWLYLPLVPIGTIAGITLFGWLRLNARTEAEARAEQ